MSEEIESARPRGTMRWEILGSEVAREEGVTFGAVADGFLPEKTARRLRVRRNIQSRLLEIHEGDRPDHWIEIEADELEELIDDLKREREPRKSGDLEHHRTP